MNNRSSPGHVTLVDAHVHLYDCFDLRPFLHSALSNFQREAIRCAQGYSFAGVLLLAESAKDRWFDRLRKYAGENSGETAGTIGRWTFHQTDEGYSLRVCEGKNRNLYIIAGRQVITSENLEVLALATPERFEDGGTLKTVIRTVIENGAIPVIPWGFGKWTGRRARVLKDVLEANRLSPLFLGDNGGRPRFWPQPSFLRMARKKGLRLLPGSDPLPFPAESRRPGSFGFLFHGRLDPEQPAAALKSILFDPTAHLEDYGKPVHPFRVFRNQGKIHIVRRLQKKRSRVFRGVPCIRGTGG